MRVLASLAYLLLWLLPVKLLCIPQYPAPLSFPPGRLAKPSSPGLPQGCADMSHGLAGRGMGLLWYLIAAEVPVPINQARLGSQCPAAGIYPLVAGPRGSQGREGTLGPMPACTCVRLTVHLSVSHSQLHVPPCHLWHARGSHRQ